MAFTESIAGGVVFTRPGIFPPGVTAAFSTRIGGVSDGFLASLNLGTSRGDDPAAVRENYRRFGEAAGFDWQAVAAAKQVHGDVIRAAAREDGGKGLRGCIDYECDALVTDIPGLPLMVFSADCTPVLLYDPKLRVVGAAHAGWRGTALSIAGKTAAEMVRRYGCKPGDILAAIGPCISACCFETDGDVPAAMRASFGDAAGDCMIKTGEKWRVDLKALNRLSLERAGLRPENIDVSPDCTVCMPDRYYSHRRTGEKRGSLGAVIALTK